MYLCTYSDFPCCSILILFHCGLIKYKTLFGFLETHLRPRMGPISCVSVFCLCERLPVYHMLMKTNGAHEDQKKVSHPLEPELQMV